MDVLLSRCSPVRVKLARHLSRCPVITSYPTTNNFRTCKARFMGYAARQLTLDIKDFDTIETLQSRVLTALGNSQSAESAAREVDIKTRQAVIIFGTPRLAPLFEPEADFVPNLLKTITRQLPEATTGELGIDVVCACVDGVSPPDVSESEQHARLPGEGLSIKYGNAAQLLPNLPLGENGALPNSEKPASITFQSSGVGHVDVTLPLANTLFTNGRLSTLLTSRWQVNGDGSHQIEAHTRRGSLVINVSSHSKNGNFNAHVPAVSITVARQIQSGLGNIVRTLNYGGSEGSQPASRELEEKVNAYLKLSSTHDETIKVWALVIPKDVFEQHSTNVMGMMIEPNDIGHWISKGASLCRVLSGGGGWGVKAGLLSLDPQTTYNDVSEAWLDRDTNNAPDFSTTNPSQQQMTALGNVAKPGSYIQFVIAQNRGGLTTSLAPKDNQGGTTTLGTVASTIDNIPSRKEKDAKSPVGDREAIIVREGQFGFVSEGGMFLRHETTDTEGKVCETKIDLPHSLIYMAQGAGKA